MDRLKLLRRLVKVFDILVLASLTGVVTCLFLLIWRFNWTSVKVLVTCGVVLIVSEVLSRVFKEIYIELKDGTKN
mgnify:CR=1 FL=1